MQQIDPLIQNLERCTCGSGVELAQIQLTLTSRSKQLADSICDLRQRGVELRNAQLALDERERAILEQRQKQEVLENQLNSNIQDREQRVQNVISAEKEVKQLQWKIDPWTEEIKRLEEEAAASQEESAAKQSKVHDEKKRILSQRETLETSKRELSAEAGVIKQELKDLASRIDATMDSLEKSRGGIASMKHWDKRLAPLKREAKEREEEAQAQAEAAEQALGEVEEQMVALQTEKARLRQALVASERVPVELEDAEADLAADEQNFATMQKDTAAQSLEARARREELRLRAKRAEAAVVLARQAEGMVRQAEEKVGGLTNKEGRAGKDRMSDRKLQDLADKAEARRQKIAKLKRQIEGLHAKQKIDIHRNALYTDLN